jgi:hypothetical protein
MGKKLGTKKHTKRFLVNKIAQPIWEILTTWKIICQPYGLPEFRTGSSNMVVVITVKNSSSNSFISFRRV